MGEQCSANPPAGQQAHPLLGPLVLWTALGVALVIKTAAAPAVHTVFPKFAAGAEHWWAGRPLYEDVQGLGAFRYSPAFAILMTPFARLGLLLGGVSWSLFNLGAYLWGLRRLAADVLPGAWPAPRLGVLLVLAMPAAIRGFWNGQSNPLVAACLMLSAAAVARHRWWTAAALLTGAVYLKLAPLAVALLFLAAHPRPLGWRLLIGLTTGGLLPFLTQSPGYVANQYGSWFEHLLETSQHRWPSFRDARTLWEWAGQPTDGRLYAGLQLAAGLLLAAWCLRRKRLAGSQTASLPAILWSTGIVYLMLFGPAIEYATYPLVAPVAAWVVLESWERHRGRWLALSGFLLIVVVGSFDRQFARLLPAAQAALPAGVLLLGAWILIHVRPTDPRRIADDP